MFRSDSKFNMEIYIEFLTTQAKTLSFLAFVGKTYQVETTSYYMFRGIRKYCLF
jgi:hypothetical protein